ncbi:hypothetical protein [Enterococcus rotai]|uniref:hypothetical protein n=1 Tax=Enterococcus rotai TaxID=118060 RepID=UPI004048B750
MRATGYIINLKAKVNISMQKHKLSMMELGMMVRSMGSVFRHTWEMNSTMALGVRIEWKAMGNMLGKMAQITVVNSRIIKSTDKAFKHGPQVNSIRDIGSKVSSTVKAYNQN